MENWENYLHEQTVIFPQPYKFGSFVRIEHAKEAVEMALKQASKNFIKPDVIKLLSADSEIEKAADEYAGNYAHIIDDHFEAVAAFKEWFKTGIHWARERVADNIL